MHAFWNWFVGESHVSESVAKSASKQVNTETNESNLFETDLQLTVRPHIFSTVIEFDPVEKTEFPKLIDLKKVVSLTKTLGDDIPSDVVDVFGDVFGDGRSWFGPPPFGLLIMLTSNPIIPETGDMLSRKDELLLSERLILIFSSL